MTNLINKALQEWMQLLGTNNVVSKPANFKRYETNTICVEREVIAVVKVTDCEKIPSILEIANKYGISVYPISTGNNWGYGCASPVEDNSVIIDLSGLNKILDFDMNSGHITIEPGVTQQTLYTYLQENKLDFLVPTTGAGPSCSIIGNALERGYGITPFADHFSSLISIEAVLPNGSIYRSPLSEFGAFNVAKIFKYGVGPYLDGLFTQSNFGIVTKATIALAKRKEALELFMFPVIDSKDLPCAVSIVRELKESLGSIVGGINLMNAERMSAMFDNKTDNRGALNSQVPQWVGVGALYGSTGLISEAKKIVNSKLKKTGISVNFFNYKKIKTIDSFRKIVPNSMMKNFFKRVDAVREFLNVLDGVPSNIALPLVYLKSGKLPDSAHDINPTMDDCGLMWFSPLVPIDGKLVEIYVKNVREICKQNQVAPLITLTTISEVCFDSTVPILFDKKNGLNDARQCYKELFLMAQELGIMPYRMSIDSMNIYRDKNNLTSVKLINSIKKLLDPKNILAPGRYGSYSINDYIENKMEAGNG
jgi:4-cresol dehydrogenase (hydroxylating) flavoprotein subunit